MIKASNKHKTTHNKINEVKYFDIYTKITIHFSKHQIDVKTTTPPGISKGINFLTTSIRIFLQFQFHHYHLYILHMAVLCKIM